MVREFTVAVFVVHAGKVLLHWHRRLQRWLPPGGHIEAGELPDEAAIRETREETGLDVELVDAPPGADAFHGMVDGPRRLTQPLGIQLEDIAPGHQHVDLLYLARPKAGTTPSGGLRAEMGNPDGRPGWFGSAEWRAIPVTAEIDRWATTAVAVLSLAAAANSPRRSSGSPSRVR
ncbi:MAG: NUDIX hydrolase [Chloroflexota bacterium]